MAIFLKAWPGRCPARISCPFSRFWLIVVGPSRSNYDAAENHNCWSWYWRVECGSVPPRRSTFLPHIFSPIAFKSCISDIGQASTTSLPHLYYYYYLDIAHTHHSARATPTSTSSKPVRSSQPSESASTSSLQQYLFSATSACLQSYSKRVSPPKS